MIDMIPRIEWLPQAATLVRPLGPAGEVSGPPPDRDPEGCLEPHLPNSLPCGVNHAADARPPLHLARDADLSSDSIGRLKVASFEVPEPLEGSRFSRSGHSP